MEVVKIRPASISATDFWMIDSGHYLGSQVASSSASASATQFAVIGPESKAAAPLQAWS